ncbi:MAG: alpha/beta hydrolase family protein [Hyphomicrobiaceae bacterium]
MALLLALLLALATPGLTAIRFKRTGEATLGGADALAGVPAACEIGRRHVWVEVEGRGECIAFYATNGLQTAKRAVLYFEGDIPPTYSRDPRKLRAHLASLQSTLEVLATTYRIPYVLVARPGTFGSTGNHGDRRKNREYFVMRAAVDAIREKFGLDDVSLAGQSGGATIVGALLVLGISNIRCAVPASGGYDLHAMLDWHAAKQGIVGAHHENPASLSGSFNVMDRLGNVRHDPARRVFVVADPEDQVTPFVQQQRFTEGLRSAGHHAELVLETGGGPQRHGLSLAALKLAGLCATGASNSSIHRAIKGR